LKNSENARSVSTYPVHENATAIEPPFDLIRSLVDARS
jgi:hypothetical protein